MKVANKLILCAGALSATNAAKVQAQARLQIQSKALAEAGEGVTVQTESGIEALSEGFLEAEAQSEAKMVAQQEAQLAEENRVREAEKHTFLAMASAKEQKALAQKDSVAKSKKEEIKPLVLQNFDASTGKVLELKTLQTPSPTAKDLTAGKSSEAAAAAASTREIESIKSVNNSITEADKLINELKHKEKIDNIKKIGESDMLTMGIAMNQKKSSTENKPPAAHNVQANSQINIGAPIPDPLEHTRYGEGNSPSTNELPVPKVLVKPLVITNVKDVHDFTPPYKDHRPPKVFNPEIHLATQHVDPKKALAQATTKRIDPLEHTRYGEGNHPSTNEEPVPVPLTKPLVITNVKDEHDFTPPYKDHRPAPVYKPGMEIIAQKGKMAQKNSQPIQSLASTGPSGTQGLLHQNLLVQQKSQSLAHKKDDEKKEVPFPIASSVNQGKTQEAAVGEMMRMPKHKPEEKKSKALAQKKGDEEKKEAPFPIASSVNQGKTQVAAVEEMMRLPKAKPEEKKSLAQKKGDEEKKEAPFQIASSVNQGKTQVAAVEEMMRLPKAKPEEKKSLAQKKGDEEKKEAPFQIASSVNQGKTQVAAVEEMMRLPKSKPEEKKALVQKQAVKVTPSLVEKKVASTAKRIDPLEHTRYGEGNHPSTNEEPVPAPLTKPLVITNVKDEHDFTPPYKDHRPAPVYKPGMEIIAQTKMVNPNKPDASKIQALNAKLPDCPPGKVLVQQKRIDPLEHTRYGEGNHPSTNEEPVPAPLTKPLVITNCKDEHDFTPPYKDHRPAPVYKPGMEIIAQKDDKKQKSQSLVQSEKTLSAGNLKKQLNFPEQPESINFVKINDADKTQKKEVDIKVVPVAKGETKKGSPTELTISQDFHKTEPKKEEFSMMKSISNFFSRLFHW